MKTKAFASGAALLLTLLVLNAPVSTAQKGSAASKKGTGFMDVAQVFARLANVLDNVKSLPNALVDYINALCAVTLSEQAINNLFASYCGCLEMIIVIRIVLYIAEIIGSIIGMIALFISFFLPPVIGLLWGFPVCVLILGISAMAGAVIGLIIAGSLDSAMGLSSMCGGICSSIYFALTPLWQLLSKIVEPILGIVSMVFPLFDMAIDNFMSLIAKPCIGFSDLSLRELYRA
jgi:phage-related protein